MPTLLESKHGCILWLLSACKGTGSKCEQYPCENQYGKSKKTQHTSDLPRILSTIAENGLTSIYQIIYGRRRHTSLLVFSHNSRALENMNLQIWKFLMPAL